MQPNLNIGHIRNSFSSEEIVPTSNERNNISLCDKNDENERNQLAFSLRLRSNDIEAAHFDCLRSFIYLFMQPHLLKHYNQVSF
jgi:hypothetical protein